MKNHLTIEALWQSYKTKVLKNAINPVQLMETKRGFFAGAVAFKKILAAISLSDCTDEQGAFFLAELDMEIKKFSIDVKNGNQ